MMSLNAGSERAVQCTNVAIMIIIDKKNCRSNYRISLFLSNTRLDVKKLQFNFVATCAVNFFVYVIHSFISMFIDLMIA